MSPAAPPPPPPPTPRETSPLLFSEKKEEQQSNHETTSPAVAAAATPAASCETLVATKANGVASSLTSRWRQPQSNGGGQQQLHPHKKKHLQQHLPITPAYRKLRYERRKQFFGCSLAVMSAYADILCYHSFGCYGNMMTGNTIKLMDLIAAGRWTDASYYAVIVPAYVVGAGLCTILNRLDLTWLGLGGPSDEAFQHLQPPRRLRSPQEISVLRVVAVGCVVLFLAGEVAGRIVPGGAADPWRLPFFACAFGLLNAATLAAINIVTNAVTGHWIAVGVGMADDWPTLLNRQNSNLTSARDDDSAAAPDGPAGQEPQSGNQKKWQSSMSVAISFLVAIIVTSLLYNECLREVQHHPDWPLAYIFIHGPPMGVIFSIVYATLLYWYTLPPPFLVGYNSSVDLVDF
jgi:Protein of unknown function (DUF1275)